MEKMLTQEELEHLLAKRQGIENQKKLKRAHVAIAGLGGLGSNVAAMLVRAGVGSLHLVDFDRVEGSNLNRQFYQMKHLGMPKTEALAEELLEINPYLKLRKDQVRVTEENAGKLFAGARLICEAFDGAQDKAMLVNTLLAKLPGAVLVAGSGMAGMESANRIQTKKRMRRLYVCGDEVSDVEEDGCIFAARVTLCAAHQAHMILRLILGLEGDAGRMAEDT